VGVLLGQNTGTNVRVSNSFAGMSILPVCRTVRSVALTLTFWLLMSFMNYLKVNNVSLQFPSKKTTKIRPSGTSTTTTSNP
jgi:hypothetical protein